MKKLYLVLVAAIMLFFASCDSGSKQYKEWKSAYNDYEKAIDKAKTCDELESVYENFDKQLDKLVDKYFDEDMPEKEEKEINALEKELDKKYDQREDELCKD